MAPLTDRFIGWLAPLGRTRYAAWGFGLMAVKYNLDRVLVGQMSGRPWTFYNYWQPSNSGFNWTRDGDREIALALLAAAVPFIAAGVLLTARRLRDIGWPLWLAALFFVPGVNLVLFAMLVFVRGAGRGAPVPEPGLPRWASLATRIGLHRRIISAAVAIGVTAAVTVAFTAVVTRLVPTYGWGIFVAIPFTLGMFAAGLHGLSALRSFGECLTVAAVAVTVCGVAIIAFAVEGVICALMAAPIAYPVAVIGAGVGYVVQLTWWGRALDSGGRVYFVGWIAVPFVILLEVLHPAEREIVAVTTTVEIAASPEQVWHNVVTFSELPPPRDWVFRTGIAYPVRATIRGSGVGAVRFCEFSTGPFVEPITAWEENRRLAFDVAAQPYPMTEMSPYRHFEPAHLNGFFQSRRGEFRLTPLPGGRTRLDGTTWYTQEFSPAPYWRLWSDFLVHRIHARVLEHIQAEAERTGDRTITNN